MSNFIGMTSLFTKNQYLLKDWACRKIQWVYSTVYSTLEFVYLLKWIIDAVNALHMMQNSLEFSHKHTK